MQIQKPVGDVMMMSHSFIDDQAMAHGMHFKT